ncbi:MAG: glycosyltransferase family 2 protein [Bacteroidaceae bacterium]|nr:glycosyltransferase family 2 protein [Bacteroidaceae bacterium]
MEQATQGLLSLIIVEYNSIAEIRLCVNSLLQYLTQPFEVIVSSNSCYSHEQRHAIEASEDTANTHVRWLYNERNGGFAYAMNRGLQESRGEYLVIMNSDCLLRTPITSMIDFMRHHPEVGAIAPQMQDNQGRIQDTARPYVSLSSYVHRQFRRIFLRDRRLLNPDMDYSRVQTVDWLIGAFIMVSRRAYELTGGLDERLFMYAEDLDWCTRIRQAGLEVVYYPRVLINYKGTRRARTNLRYARIFVRSHILYWRKFGFFWGYPPRLQRYYDE